MTVRDFLRTTHDYQDISLTIKSYGDEDMLFRGSIPNDKDLASIKELSKYMDSNITSIHLFDNCQVKLILEHDIRYSFTTEEKVNILAALEFILNRSGHIDGEPLTEGYRKLESLFTGE